MLFEWERTVSSEMQRLSAIDGRVCPFDSRATTSFSRFVSSYARQAYRRRARLNQSCPLRNLRTIRRERLETSTKVATTRRNDTAVVTKRASVRGRTRPPFGSQPTHRRQNDSGHRQKNKRGNAEKRNPWHISAVGNFSNHDPAEQHEAFPRGPEETRSEIRDDA